MMMRERRAKIKSLTLLWNLSPDVINLNLVMPVSISLTLVLLNPDTSYLENIVDPDKLVSD